MSDAKNPSDPSEKSSRTTVKKIHTRLEGLKQPFLEAYEELENQTLACKRVGISWDTVAKWKKDEKFMKLFINAHIRAQSKNNDLLRQSMLQRAVQGNPHYLIKNGEFVRDEKGQKMVAYYEMETQLTMFMAKNRMPNEFRDKFELEITSQIVKMLVTDFFGILRRRLTEAQLIPIQKELETTVAKLTAHS